MTCNNCLHADVCENFLNEYGQSIKVPCGIVKNGLLGITKKKCPFEKEKSRFIELPCVSQLYNAVSALADMVAQFGYSTTFRNQEAVCDGGLSALENAFSALQDCGCQLTSNGKITLKSLWEFVSQMKEQSEKALKEKQQ